MATFRGERQPGKPEDCLATLGGIGSLASDTDIERIIALNGRELTEAEYRSYYRSDKEPWIYIGDNGPSRVHRDATTTDPLPAFQYRLMTKAECIATWGPDWRFNIPGAPEDYIFLPRWDVLLGSFLNKHHTSYYENFIVKNGSDDNILYMNSRDKTGVITVYSSMITKSYE